MKSDRRLSLSERWFRLLLRLYPADFRDEMGEGLLQTYLDRCRKIPLALVWFAALRESLIHGLAERLQPAASWRRSGNWAGDTERVIRRLARAPFFVIAVVATLTIGLGGFAVVYTAVEKILLEPMPYRNPGDLYFVWRDYRAYANLGRGWLSGPDVAELQKAGGVIEDVAAMQLTGPTLSLTRDGEPQQIRMMLISPNLFDLLGVAPAMGRNFERQETGPKRPSIVILTNKLWKRLGSNPAIVGSEVWLSGSPYRVIGVMPESFQFAMHSSLGTPQEPDLYTTFRFDLSTRSPDDGTYAGLMRAQHGTPPERLAAAVSAVGRFIDERDNHGRGLKLYPTSLHADLVKEVRPALFTLTLAGLVMVVALTVNLASLLLARATEKEKEVAVSRALGANVVAVIRAMVVEGAVLGALGGIGGAIAGLWGVRLLVSLAPLDLPRRETISLDWMIALVVIAVGTLAGFIAACIPAGWAAKVSLQSLVSTTSVRGAGRAGRMRRVMIVAQIAVSLIMLSAGGLIVRSFETLLRADPGFRAEGVVTAGMSVGPRLFPKSTDGITFQDRVEAAVSALPGVTQVSGVSALPLSAGADGPTDVLFPGAPGNTGDPAREGPLVDVITSRPGYVQAMGMRLVAGRDFEPSPQQNLNEVLIDRRLAQQFFPESTPVGTTLMLHKKLLTVVGVVDQARLYALYEDGRPQILLRQNENYPYAPYLVVRTGRDPQSLISELSATIRRIDPRIAVSNARTMDDIVTDALRQQRISTVLITGFALGALLLLLMGLFGLISGSVARRRGELAVRMALGATHGNVIKLVVSEGAQLLAIGFLLGIPGVYAAGRVMHSLLIGISPFDPRALLAVAAGFVSLALLACYLAARRVTAIEPERLLRDGG